MMWWNHGWGWGDWFGMSLMMLVFWGLVIWLIVWLVRSSSSNQETTPAAARPEDILRERFARGEIDETEYHDRLRVLRGGSAAPPTRADTSGVPR
jgi:putative membrane protein